MRILLIYPYCLDERTRDDDVRAVPIGLYYVGALLKQHNYSVEILNWFDINKTPAKIKKTLTQKRPDIIGFSVLHANRWGGIEIARIAKKLNPRVKIVFGGVGPTFLWQHLLSRFKSIDYCVLGEGEYSFLNLVRCLEKKDYAGLADIAGLALRSRQGEVMRTAEPEPIADIDLLPNPARYFSFQHVVSSRGCPWSCTFCGSPRFWQRKVRFHSPAWFVDQLELLYEKGVKFFYVSDDTFTLKSERVIEICRQILARGLKITWVAISRVNCINEEVLFWMRKAGCIQISYGVESGSEQIRDFLNKNINTEDIKQAFSLTRRYGILPRAYFIYGSPGETEQTIAQSIALIDEIAPLDLASYILDIYPGTALYDLWRQKTGNTDDIWQQRIEDIMYFEIDPALSAEQIMGFGRRLRQAFYGNLHRYAGAIELVDNKELYREHSDFCSRLGMTFSHGDFAANPDIQNKEETAARLFRQALRYWPDHRAYLGLGILYQKKKNFRESIRILTEGLRHFPFSEPLHICLAISHMNLQEFGEALEYLEKFEGSTETRPYLAACRKELRIHN